MDEIDEWTVGPIPIRPAPGPAAPRPSPDDAAPPRSVAGTPDPGLIREPSRRFGQASGPKTQAQGAVACPYARDSGHASVAVEAPSRDSMPSVAPAPAPIRPEPSSFVAASPESVRDGLEPSPTSLPRPTASPVPPSSSAVRSWEHARLGHRRRLRRRGGRVREAKATEQSRDRCESSLGSSRPPDANWTRPWKRRNGREDGSEDREGSEDHRQAEPRGIREDARHGLLRRVRRGRPGHGRREGGQEREDREDLREGDTDGREGGRGVEARQDRRRRVTAAQGFGRQGPGRQDPGDVVEGHQSPRCRRDRQASRP